MPGPSDVPGPRELFERMRRYWLDDVAITEGGLLAEDVVVEMPFAPPGRPRRVEGRERFAAFAAQGRAALPVRFDEIRELAVHETADPEVIVVEYEITGTVTTTGRRATAPFVGVLRARDGKVTHWREYQDAMAIAEALGRPAGSPPAGSPAGAGG
ncbi:nuclear transport factor 2 family protein [Streptosporangium sp. NPDC051022]|uniref:nuclear transport factor 2 family protein n=1 Tax=Streptosporangium sp. NPDC051022 TaxID=3155752 RepID=UPI00343E6E11